MNIILIEERADGGQSPERSFSTAVIRIGRESGENDIAFENTLYPMVSRKHAELRWNEGKWTLFDLNSTYGTFVDGQPVVAPRPIAVGNRLQFGKSGPILRVVWFEVASDSAHSFTSADSPVQVPVQRASTVPIAAENAPQQGVNIPPPRVPFADSDKTNAQPTRPQQPDRAQLEFAATPGRPPFILGQNTVWLGRETVCDITFEPEAVMVSRKHASIRLEDNNYILEDNNSFNGTLVNEQRISTPTPLYHADEIRLGLGGPVLRFNSPARIPPKGASLAGQRSIAAVHLADASSAALPIDSKTMVFKLDKAAARLASDDSAQPQLLMTLAFGQKKELTIGRGEKNDIKLDGLQISNRHARLLQTGTEVVIDDLNSTNGTYINGRRISRQTITPNDAVQIGSYLIRVDQAGNIGIFDTRSKTRIDAVNLTKEVRNRFGGGRIQLLDSISLSIQPNEFIGLLGPSGAGKSMLMEALNGMRPATGGNVLINNLDLYRHLDSLKQAIGYVPQDDIIHRELTVYRTLYYIAKLRLSRDVSSAEISQTINEVLDVTGLAERRNVRVDQLSGGQRKRVSIAVELITKPSVIFLDEPTSGLDPATEEKIMRLFRQIAESGRTAIMTTHAMENIKLFDKIVVLMRGKLVFYGKPDDALKHLQAASFKDLYDKLDKPVEEKVRAHGGANRQQLTEQTAEEWKQKFTQTPQYRQNIYEPLKELGKLQPTGVRKKRRLGVFGAISQWFTLSRRYLEVLFKDKLNLFILFAQAPIIALLTFFVMGDNLPRDFVYFVLSLVAIWFGTSVAAREIIRERPIYRRERMVNLGILPYVGSKLFVLGLIVGLQCLMLFVPLKLFDLVGLMAMPGETYGLPQLWAMLLTAGVGIALGLLVSALVRTSEMATSLVPLILIPQILFSGLVGVPSGINQVAGLLMPAAWSFDTMKRFSTLDTLEEEGADPAGKTGGLGLYKFTERENEKIIDDSRKNLENYQKDAEEKFRQYDRELRGGGNPALPKPDEPPAIPGAKKIPEDLSGYITFLNPWMNEVVNQIVLMLMFGILVIVTLIVLRIQDIG